MRAALVLDAIIHLKHKVLKVYCGDVIAQIRADGNKFG